MLRASARTGDGRRVVILGLTNENLRRMIDNRPVSVDLATLGVPGTSLYIFHGMDEPEVRRKFAELVPNAVESAPALPVEPGG